MGEDVAVAGPARRLAVPLAALALLACGTATAAGVEKKPLWEIGLAAGLFSLPQYPGSDERYLLPLGIPYLIYRGKILRADRKGVRGILYDGERLGFDLGFGFGLPVRNGNEARDGMPDLRLTGQVGPRLNWRFAVPEGAPAVGLHVPVRYARDIGGKSLGWVAEPSLSIERRRLGPGGKGRLRADLGLLYASASYNDYYYGVDPVYATAGRPAYAARRGLHSLFAGLAASWQFSRRLNLGGFLRLRTLKPGVVSDSPLVREELALSAGVGFAWTFRQSQTRVEVR